MSSNHHEPKYTPVKNTEKRQSKGIPTKCKIGLLPLLNHIRGMSRPARKARSSTHNKIK